MYAVFESGLFYAVSEQAHNELIVDKNKTSLHIDKGRPIAEKRIFFSKYRNEYLEVWVQTHQNLVKLAGLFTIATRTLCVSYDEAFTKTTVLDVPPNSRLGKAVESYLEEDGGNLTKFLLEEE